MIFSHAAFQAAVLGVVQGLAEFLPISSSAHLVLVRWLLGWSEFLGGPAVEKAFDVMLHAGTFVAVVSYFWEDIKGFTQSLFSSKGDPHKKKLLGYLVISTIPGGLFGVLFEKAAEEKFSQPLPIALFLLSLGIVLLFAERFSRQQRHLNDVGLTDAILIGITQAFALLPGVSRSGITISTSLFLGLTREAAARYSFLMSIPIIGGAVLWETTKLIKMHLSLAALFPFVWGFAASAIVGYLCIRFFLRYLTHGTFYGFALYRIVVAIAVIAALKR